MMTKTFKEKWEDFEFRLKIFAGYLFTEPFRQLFLVFKAFGSLLSALNKLTAWMHILLASGIVFLIIGDRLLASFFLSVLLLAVVLYEWEKGTFMYRYRQNVLDKVRKKAEEEGYLKKVEETKKYTEVKENEFK